MSDEVAIRVSGISKSFVLPHDKVTSVKGAFTSFGARHKKTKEVQHALRDINFEIKQGEFFGIVGRNGSGKSTLLKILASIYQPSAGKVHTEGKLVPFIELGVGFNPELTGRENVYLNGAMLGFSEKEVRAMYDDIVSFAELEVFMDQKLKNYSSGMQVRLAFSMATRSQADILLVDEVLAVGDADFQRKCYDYFRSLKKQKKTVVFVSHDMDAVRQFCDRAALIEKSNLVSLDSSDKIAELYLQLFLEDARSKEDAEPDSATPAKRWGSQAVTIEKPVVNEKIAGDDTTTLRFSGELHFTEAIEKPVIGFKIVDGAGRALVGTNTSLLKMKTGVYAPGDRLPFSWSVPNIFSNGSYMVSLAVVTESDAPLDIWDDALSFEVMKSARTPYPVTPEITLKLDN